MGGEIQKAKDLLFGMAYTEGDYDQMIELVEKLVSRAEAAEAELAEYKENQELREYNLTCRALDTTPEGREFLARLSGAERELAALKEALTKIAEDPIIGMYQMREIAKKSLKGGEW